MFGYVTPNQALLNEDDRVSYHAVYCGLCHSLRKRHGLMGTATLSNDLTFLAILHSALYEPHEEHLTGRCTAHPIKAQHYIRAEYLSYAADMNLVLAYHKCRDNWMDDRNLLSGTEGLLLRRAYRKVRNTYPQQCNAIEEWLSAIHVIEERDDGQIDPPVNLTGRMLGTLFVRDPSDFWADTLYRIGEGIGRFIYLMDAYDDLERDIRHHSFNPLRHHYTLAGFEDLIYDGLTLAVADSTAAFEELPILRYADILRNILYSGIWTRYAAVRKKRDEKAKE